MVNHTLHAHPIAKISKVKDLALILLIIIISLPSLHLLLKQVALLSLIKRPHDALYLTVKFWTLAIAPLTWVRLVTSSALQSRKWQLIGMSQWCRSALCGHPLPALTDNWTHGAASRHTIAPISHTRPSPRSRRYYSFPIPLRVWGCVGLPVVSVIASIVQYLERSFFYYY